MIKKIIKKLFFKNKIDYSNLTVEIDDRSREYVKSAGKFSLKSEVEMWTIICCLRNLLNQNVDGDIVETGVWKGGTLILLKKILDEFNIKKIFLVLIHLKMALMNQVSLIRKLNTIILTTKIYL